MQVFGKMITCSAKNC